MATHAQNAWPRPAVAERILHADATNSLASVDFRAISLSALGCSASDSATGRAECGGRAERGGRGSVAGGGNDAGAAGESPNAASIAVVQVETVTTVQSSAGSFLLQHRNNWCPTI